MSGPVRAIALALAVMLAAVAAPALAGLKATYVTELPKDTPKEIGDMRMVVYVDDTGRDRTDIVTNGKTMGSVIYRDGETYLIEHNPDGTVVVSRQSDLMTVMRETFLATLGKFKFPKEKVPATMYRIVDLGPESVNGRAGMRYGLVEEGVAKGVEPLFQSVVSTDPALAPLARIMARQMLASQQSIAGIFPESTNLFTMTAAILAKGAPLRMEKLMHLDSVETVDIDPKLFDLPGPVQTIDQIRARRKPIEPKPSDEPSIEAPAAEMSPPPPVSARP